MGPSPAADPSRSRLPDPIPHTLSPYTCIDFVNSRYTDHTGTGEVFDRLESREWREWYAGRCGVTPSRPASAATVRTLMDLRRVVRKLLESGRHPYGATLSHLNDVLSAPDQFWELSRLQRTTRLRLSWRRPDWPAVMAATAASYAELLASGGVSRVRACENPDCTFLFFDESRNRSRRWCESAACGNLVKVRAHRARRQRAAATLSGRRGPR
jgi:predicted RNA-binding Zn ribbon-like protein